MSMAAELITRPGSVHRGLKLGHDEDLGDCEAFLLGQLAEYKEAHYQYVASWEWTNLLAHGSEDDLRVELATAGRNREPSGDTANGAWRAARTYVATKLMMTVDSYHPLSDIQRRVLIPLELDLAASAQAARWRPYQWVMAVESELDSYRGAHRAPPPPRNGERTDGYQDHRRG
jgi:hypothetical protein